MQFGNTVIAPDHTFHLDLVVTREDIAKFAGLCENFNPLHHDEDYAKTTRFGSIIAVGPQIMSLFTSMVATHFSEITPMVGVDFSSRSAIRAGDTLRMHWTVSALTPSEKMKGTLAHLQGEVRNAKGIVIKGKGLVLLMDKL
ncbi:dehydratase [Burkholderia lata]|uniref:Dehydratase n=1 Tax=Burkholderia lata (strain ATCC 17760 / DSM 23089 / LMG 22485 / NCIMB 9086 / R18194 / 383) TaxID=482957 RepID=A0A6P2V1F1_BURL3|nr:MaoC family dehydratase [Burkholderia lata]VWC75784.1 dehydratase [Burkholderia lata]